MLNYTRIEKQQVHLIFVVIHAVSCQLATLDCVMRRQGSRQPGTDMGQTVCIWHAVGTAEGLGHAQAGLEGMGVGQAMRTGRRPNQSCKEAGFSPDYMNEPAFCINQTTRHDAKRQAPHLFEKFASALCPRELLKGLEPYWLSTSPSMSSHPSALDCRAGLFGHVGCKRTCAH